MAAEEPSPPRVATAIRAEIAPRVDGVLDDPAWQGAPVHGGFVQREPVQGPPATEITTFQVAYDDAALYVAVRCLDSAPDRIVSRLARRDDYPESDWVCVQLDPRLDQQTGMWFTVFASGSLNDGAYAWDSELDSAWDGVWEARTRIDDHGWTAEYRIPYHVLRFAPRAEYEWGFNVQRRVTRKQEEDHWNLIREDRPGRVSQFGRLRGIRQIHPPAHVELLPYAMGRVLADGDADWLGRLGGDLRYALTPGVSLNATVNPDFGQVEADPARLNLTAFEDFFPERRPFFIEGAAIFQNSGDFELFHSRRIGRQPAYFELPDDAAEVSGTEATTILGALKLTGRTAGGTTFGLLDALTAAEHSTVERTVGPVRYQRMLREPLTHYLAGRVTQQVGPSRSLAGALVTAVNRRDGSPGYVGAVDWHLKSRDQAHNLVGVVAASRTGDADDRQQGYLTHLEAYSTGGWLEGWTGVVAYSPGVDLNDLGYLRRADLVQTWVGTKLRRHEPVGPFRQFDVEATGLLEWNYDGTPLGRSVELSSWAYLLNNWELHAEFGRGFAAMNDDDVIRDGPVIERLASFFTHGQVATDRRRAVSFSVRPELRRTDGGRSFSRNLTLGLQWRPAASLLVSVSPYYEHGRIDAQWVDPIAEQVAGATVVHPVYGELDGRTLDLTTRAQVSFTPHLSLDFFLQPFVTVGEYKRFKELVEPETYRFQPYDLAENRSYHQRSVRSNLVLRWEFRPGSALFLVWSQSRSADLEDPLGEELEFRPFDRLRRAFTDEGDNVLLTKVSYWVGG
ncbi:MAG: DUF5916 domain-containing protein [Candidatus Latescibacterota bacterium]|jgi:hypothetical protein